MLPHGSAKRLCESDLDATWIALSLLDRLQVSTAIALG